MSFRPPRRHYFPKCQTLPIPVLQPALPGDSAFPFHWIGQCRGADSRSMQEGGDLFFELRRMRTEDRAVTAAGDDPEFRFRDAGLQFLREFHGVEWVGIAEDDQGAGLDSLQKRGSEIDVSS